VNRIALDVLYLCRASSNDKIPVFGIKLLAPDQTGAISSGTLIDNIVSVLHNELHSYGHGFACVLQGVSVNLNSKEFLGEYLTSLQRERSARSQLSQPVSETHYHLYKLRMFLVIITMQKQNRDELT
jgi:hypothetical protein